MADFALDLDHHAIALLRRTPEGWEPVGEARLNDPDLGARLGELREAGERLAGGPLRCDLVVPESQVLRTELDPRELGGAGLNAGLGVTGLRLPGLGAEDWAQAIGATVSERTGAPASDLAIDWRERDGALHVAVIARETLKEADAFAASTGFGPQRIVARDPSGALSTEAASDFGPAPSAPEPRAAPSVAPDAEDQATGADIGERDEPEAAPIEGPDEDTATAEPVEGLAPTGLADDVGAGEPLGSQDQPPLALTEADRADPTPVARTAPPRLGERPRRTSAERRMPSEGAPAGLAAARPRPRRPARRGQRALLATAGVGATLALASAAVLMLAPGVDGPGEVAVAPEPPVAEEVTRPETPPAEPEAEVVVLPPEEPPARETAEVAPPDPTGAADYAATGIWQRTPTLSDAPDPMAVSAPSTGLQVALPEPEGTPLLLAPSEVSAGTALLPMPTPPRPGATFDLGEDGRVVATPSGALSPDGITIYAASPPVRVPPRPGSEPDGPAEAPAPEAPSDDEALADAQPAPRPDASGEEATEAEEADTDEPVLAFAEVAVEETPPSGAQGASLFDAAAEPPTAAAEVPEEGLGEPGSPYAVTASLRPSNRPAELAAQVVAARRAAAEERARRAAAAPAPVAQASAARAAPEVPTTASVARRATEDNVLRLNRLNLISVAGTSRSPRALVRFPSGRVTTVRVGDRLDGGRVQAIGDGRLVYVKGGRSYALEMPRG